MEYAVRYPTLKYGDVSWARIAISAIGATAVATTVRGPASSVASDAGRNRATAVRSLMKGSCSRSGIARAQSQTSANRAQRLPWASSNARPAVGTSVAASSIGAGKPCLQCTPSRECKAMATPATFATTVIHAA